MTAPAPDIHDRKDRPVTDAIRRPPYDPEIQAVLSSLAEVMPPTYTPEMIPALRAQPFSSLDTAVDGRPVRHHERRIAGHGGAELVASVLSADVGDDPGPGVFFLHGGGMILGDRFAGVEEVVPWILELGGTAVTLEYRLAPEFPDPIPIEDAYAGLCWLVEHAAELRIDPSRVLLAGVSAGAGIAAGTALLARGRGGPVVAGMVLNAPMLDDRDRTLSTRQFEGTGIWDRGSNRTGWDALLGAGRGGPDVSIYAAPARAQDLSGLPPMLIDVGSAEVFRDEVVAFASQVWADGGIAELHVWPGGTHAYDTFAPGAAISRSAVAARQAWVRRLIGRGPS